MIDLKDKHMVRDIIKAHMEVCELQYEEDGAVDFLITLSELAQSAKNNNTDFCDMMRKELVSVIDDFCEKNELCDRCFGDLSYRSWDECPDDDGARGFYITYTEAYCEECDK